MKKRKMLAILLVAAMTAGCMAGCGQKVSESKETVPVSSEVESSVKSEPVETAAPEDEPLYPLVKDGEDVTIKGVVFGSFTEDKGDRLVWQKVEEVTGVNIEFELIDSEAATTYLASGDWPDFFLASFSDAIVYDYGVIGEKFINILDYIDYMPNLAQTFEEYPASKKGFLEENGKMYIFPRVAEAATSVSVRQYWRTDLLEEYGLKVPATVDEFKDTLAVLKEKTGKIQWIPKLGKKSFTTNTWYPGMFAAFGEYVELTFEAEDDGTVVFTRTTDQMKHFYEYMNELYEEELIHPECYSQDGVLSRSLEEEGDMLVLEFAATRMQPEMFKNGDISYLSCAAPLTSEYDSTQTIKGGSYISAAPGPYINAESEYVELMCQMFDILYATEEVVEGSGLLGDSFTYGMKGEHWDIDEGGETYSQFLPEGYAGSFSEFQSKEIRFSNLGRTTSLKDVVTSTPGNAQAREASFVEFVWPYVIDAFPEAMLNFTEDERYVIEQKWAEIETYFYEMEAKFITGIVDIETGWEEYLATLEKMGLQEVLKVYQAAYDRWCAD